MRLLQCTTTSTAVPVTQSIDEARYACEWRLLVDRACILERAVAVAVGDMRPATLWLATSYQVVVVDSDGDSSGQAE